MHRKLELEALEAELATLTLLFNDAKSIDDPVGVFQYAQRIQELEDKIKELEGASTHHASLALYFSGKPVFGSRGIAAEFAGKVLEHFQDIVSKRFSKIELGGLGERGPVPRKDLTTLMVTGVTQGSFGFLLDELTDQPEMFDTNLKEMVTEALTLIELSSSMDESKFEEATEELDPRSLSSLHDFFLSLDSSKATVRLVDDSRELSLDESAIHRARLRTEETEINEEDKDIVGTLIGFLPEHCRFEFRLSEGESEMIYGSAIKEAAGQFDEMIKKGRPVIGESFKIRVLHRIVQPRNRPPRDVYRLLEFVE